MMHLVRTFAIMHAHGVRLIAIEEAQNYGKIAFIGLYQNQFRKWLVGGPFILHNAETSAPRTPQPGGPVNSQYVVLFTQRLRKVP